MSLSVPNVRALFRLAGAGERLLEHFCAARSPWPGWGPTARKLEAPTRLLFIWCDAAEEVERLETYGLGLGARVMSLFTGVAIQSGAGAKWGRQIHLITAATRDPANG